MKKQSRCARAASLPIAPVRHQFDHEVPTVIHDPEEKLNALARFTRHLAQNPGQYSFWILAVVVLVGLVIVLNSLSVLRPAASKEWSKLMTAKTADDRIAIAKENPKSPAAVWALLQAASDYYSDGVRDLPDNRDVAEQKLKKARRALRPDRPRSAQGFLRGESRRFGKGQNTRGTQRPAQGDRAIRARCGDVARHSRGRPGQTICRRAAKARRGCILQGPVFVHFDQVYSAFTRQ